MLLLSLFWIFCKILLNPSMVLYMSQPILVKWQGDDAYESILPNHLEDLWGFSAYSMEACWAQRRGWWQAKACPLEGRGLVDISLCWSLGKASSFVGGDHDTVWPPKCVLVAMVPFCLSWKDCSEVAHGWVLWEGHLVSSFQRIAQWTFSCTWNNGFWNGTSRCSPDSRPSISTSRKQL